MKEKEVKILNVDFDEIEQILQTAGAALIKDENQINWIFKVDSLLTPEGECGYLRLRSTTSHLTQKTTHEFTLKMKEPNQKIRIYDELTTLVSDPEALIKMLNLINLPIQYRGEKTRKSYRWEGIDFEMDRWDEKTYPMPYLEIEVKEESDLDRALKLLNLSYSDVTTKSISELRKEWRRAHD